MKDKQLTKAIQIGVTCIVAYIASYYMRNLLSVLTPAMLQTGEYTKEYIGSVSSVYMILYAAGQLINGILGDRFSSKNMIVIGLIITAMSSVMFPLSSNAFLQTLCFGALGYGLSMLRGPMMKIISENTSANHARVICAFFSSASFIGAFVAGIFAALFHWNHAFMAAGIVVFVIAVAAYIVITWLEKKNMITLSFAENNKKSGIFSVFKTDKFVFYIAISILAEITTSSINFWIPTYLTEHLGFANNDANIIFIVKSVIHSICPFIAIIIYKYLSDEIKLIKYSFLAATILFIGMIFIKNIWFNIILFFTSLLASGFASAVLWSIYIPSLKNTGKVSSANGILDCTGYAGAAAANLLFAKTMDSLGWNGIIVVWAVIMFIGVIATMIEQIYKRKRIQ